MKSHARVVVVGGGVMGVGLLYHLALAGWSDIVLIEKGELTSGSTWHAAGLLPYFNMSFATTHIHDYSIRFYKTLEEETGLTGIEMQQLGAFGEPDRDPREHVVSVAHSAVVNVADCRVEAADDARDARRCQVNRMFGNE